MCVAVSVAASVAICVAEFVAVFVGNAGTGGGENTRVRGAWK